MNIKTVNFEMILKGYKPYNDGLEQLESYKNEFSQKVEDIKKEMEQIISSSRVLVLDQQTKEKNAMRIRELQAEGIRLEGDFRNQITERQNKILEDCFTQITEIVELWSQENGIDLVINSNSLVWSKDNFDVTGEIISIIMEKGLFFDHIMEKISEN